MRRRNLQTTNPYLLKLAYAEVDAAHRADGRVYEAPVRCSRPDFPVTVVVGRDQRFLGEVWARHDALRAELAAAADGSC